MRWLIAIAAAYSLTFILVAAYWLRTVYGLNKEDGIVEQVARAAPT